MPSQHNPTIRYASFNDQANHRMHACDMPAFSCWKYASMRELTKCFLDARLKIRQLFGLPPSDKVAELAIFVCLVELLDHLLHARRCLQEVVEDLAPVSSRPYDDQWYSNALPLVMQSQLYRCLQRHCPHCRSRSSGP